MKQPLALAFALLTLTLPAVAGEVCPCVPTTHIWIVQSCDTWDCAASEFVVGGGSLDIMVVPTSNTDVRRVIVKRVVAGSAISVDPTYNIESYDGWPSASARFEGIGTELKPMMLSSPDGKFLIVARNQAEPRRRAVGR